MTKKNSAWSRYSSRRKQIAINQGLVSSSAAQAQLHQAPVNGLENDLIYQVTCTYNVFVFLTGVQRGYARWGSKEWWEGERELPMPIPYIPPILTSLLTYGFPLWTIPKVPCQFLATDPRMRHSLPISFDLIMGKKERWCAAFYSCINTPFSVGGHVSPRRRKESVFRV